ncbi:hypothetical protein ABFS82_02G145000 [Erythranthe guttata]|uniref:SBP-type domain-containing protein n=1 Tax=Erythranthe guttata TaxID=4155 RepID=A0A022QX91_ERYGU|nr:hypothetical protein MIMGU_mgv1a020120mg [Erythranthe guttata]
MEYHWSSLINNSKSSSSSTTADCNTPTFNNGHHAWDSFNNAAGNFSRAAGAEQANWSYPLHYNNSVSYYSNPSAARQVVEAGAAAYQAVALREHEQEKMGGGGAAAANRCYQLDPHLTCLKLGKRQYFEDVMMAAAAPPPPAAAAKKGKPYYAVDGVQAAAVPRCQVEGCGVVLVDAKEYHRRHKVCEMHAKAPVVVVLGIQQRFCQQCSRFHRVAEFDETKRSCRRRLAGHNERRRKTSLNLDNQHHQFSHKLSLQGISRHDHDDGVINNNNIRGESCALSLLSSTNYYWTNFNTATSASRHLPETCSAALRDLIAENRASTSAFNKNHHLITNYPNNNNNHNQMDDYYNYKLNGSINNRPGSNPHGNGAGHVTLDLMEAQNSELGFMSTKERDEHQQECSELWKVPLGYR